LDVPDMTFDQERQRMRSRQPAANRQRPAARTENAVSERHVVGLEEAASMQVALVGGKGAHLAQLSRLGGVWVPAGFCVTTHAFRRLSAEAPLLVDRLEQLGRVRADDRSTIAALSADIRAIVEGIAVPDDVATAVTDAVVQLGDDAAYAVRSSATAEDLPSASFAGQQDTHLNIVGPDAVLQHVRRCWGSLFTERAVAYCQRNGIDHPRVHMAVVVQRMVAAQSAGVLFTADPVTSNSNRRVASVEATFGLGEALVAGAVNADVFKVRDAHIVDRSLAAKRDAVVAAPGGGTQVVDIDPEQQEQPALTDAQVLRLVQLGRRIEAHFGQPQDIEWCLADDDFAIVQSRPVTTLFPIPERHDRDIHVYVSVGHGQMMTEPMRPLGLSLFQLTAARPMYEAGGRLFVDVAAGLAAPATRAGLLDVLGRGDPLIGGALHSLLDRGDVIPVRPDDAPPAPPSVVASPSPKAIDPAIVPQLIARADDALDALRRDISTRSGPDLLEFILADIQELKATLFEPQSYQALMAGMAALWWLNDHLHAWLGEKGAADALTQSVPHDVTAAMGLALLDVADAIRPHAEVVAFLRQVGDDDGFLDALENIPGGHDARNAIDAWLDRYGMRCVGEIDITRPRWRERPATLVPVILGNIDHFEPGESTRRIDHGRQHARARELELVERLRALPDGEGKAADTKRMIDQLRAFIGYREHPKYGMVSRYFIYKQALLQEAERLVDAQALRRTDDMFWLTFQELHDVVRTNAVNDELIRRRADAFASYQALTPPRVLTSDGEVITGAYRRDGAPPGALVGLPVSAGIVAGRARVIFDMARADLEPGDILVTTHTDPSWTPLFVAISGLVTEVGGLMTHGAVVAREYGLPTVVGVEDATRLIADGQRLRVNGTNGSVEVIPDHAVVG